MKNNNGKGMDKTIIKIRAYTRAILAFALALFLLLSFFLLLTELNDPNANAALTALLGGIVGSLGQGLVLLIQAIASNPSDKNPERDEENTGGD